MGGEDFSVKAIYLLETSEGLEASARRHGLWPVGRTGEVNNTTKRGGEKLRIGVERVKMQKETLRCAYLFID